VHAVPLCLLLAIGNAVNDDYFYNYSEHVAAVPLCMLYFTTASATACQHMLRKPVACHKYSQRQHVCPD